MKNNIINESQNNNNKKKCAHIQLSKEKETEGREGK